jgi:hypothetical protein
MSLTIVNVSWKTLISDELVPLKPELVVMVDVDRPAPKTGSKKQAAPS